MLRSDYDETGGQQFTVKVTKTADGGFVAVAKTVPEIGEFRANSQQRAAQMVNDALAKYTADGYKVKK